MKILVWLISLTVSGGFAAEIERAFFAFENGVRFNSVEQQAQVLNELGYAGIGSARPGDLKNRLEVFAQADLKIFSLYLGQRLAGAQTPVSETIINSINELKGADTVIELHIQKGGSEDGDDVCVAFVQSVADLAAQSGLKVVLYPHSGFYIDTLSDAVRIAKMSNRNNVGVMFNLCHFLKVEPNADLADELKKAGDLLWRVSVCGADRDGTSWSQLIQPLDQGSFDQSELLGMLDAIGYQGPIGLQCYAIKGDAKSNLSKSMQRWKQLNDGSHASNAAIDYSEHYKNKLTRFNQAPHPVSSEIFMLCKGLSSEQLEEYRDMRTGPHFLTSINIFVNELAEKTVNEMGAAFPVGSVIVKEKSEAKTYGPIVGTAKNAVSGINGIGGMIKREAGYDPDHGDWEYFYSPEGGPVISGKLKNCIECHAKASATDFVFRSWVARKRLGN